MRNRYRQVARQNSCAVRLEDMSRLIEEALQTRQRTIGKAQQQPKTPEDIVLGGNMWEFSENVRLAIQ